MSDILFNILTTIVATAAGAAWYMEFMKRRKIEADLNVEKERRKLDAINQRLELNKAAYDKAKASIPIDGSAVDIPAYMYEHISKDSTGGGEGSGTGSGGMQ